MEKNIQFAERLNDRKLKATQARMEVLEVISKYNKATPFTKIQNALIGIDRVTLYRTIQALIKHGIIHKALVEKNEIFYAICSTQCSTVGHNHKHIHFKCTKCKSVTCVEATQPINLSIPGHVLESVNVEATGICPTCSH